MDRSTQSRPAHSYSPATGVLLLAMAIGGCTWQKPAAPESKFAPARAAVLHVPPKELVKAVAAGLTQPPLSLEVASVQDGTIYTTWREYEGAIHIVRRWQERTRFKINVLPDYNDPLGTSHVEVFDETQEKPSAGQPWYPNPDLRRPERSAEVLAMIEKVAAGAGAVAPAVAH